MFCTRISVVTSTIVTMMLTALFACGSSSGGRVLEDEQIRVELTPSGGLQVSLKASGGEVPLSTGKNAAFALVDSDGNLVELMPSSVESYQAPADDEFGPGEGLKVEMQPVGSSPLSELKVRVEIRLVDKKPGVIVCRADISGLDSAAMARLGGVSFYRLNLRADLADPQAAPHDFYLFQGAGYQWGKWHTRIEVTEDYAAENWTVRHLPEQREGGGYPFNYLWTAGAGLALAQIDTVHHVMSLPVNTGPDGSVTISLDRPAEFIRPDETGAEPGLPVMVGAFRGDFYAPLKAYGALLERGPFTFAKVPPDAYEPIWCGWGFGRDFTPQDIYKTLPAVRDLGIPWVVIDDGFQQSIGDWPLIKEKFPRGDADMRALVDSIHAAGFKAKLWWVPMNVQSTDPLIEEHPDWVVLDSEGREKREDWWDVSQLCPAYPPVVEQQKELVRRFLEDWDYDGFKMDGGCLGMVTPCYNPAHGHKHPEESCRAVASFFQALQQEAERIKPGAVMEVCECGLPHDPFKMQFYNQQVSADPVSSDQVRARIKTYRALLGDDAALYGDHVELSTGPYPGDGVEVREVGSDFASTLALGGVIGSKFTGLADSPGEDERKRHLGIRSHWRHWFELSDRLRLHEGTYLNLYDIGWDLPETHVVARGDTLYYGIFAQGFDGKAELRGLEPGRQYLLTDYSTGKELGRLAATGHDTFECSVDGNLLVRAAPAE
ncbi:MAG: alpha-galactosidase [Candidatus Glassbacteria bacterium]|nr:alpha-galactosidase [Candidatus Glassbacteria bacterium]